MAEIERLGLKTYVNPEGDVVGPDDLLSYDGIDPNIIPTNNSIIEARGLDYDPGVNHRAGVSVDLGERALLLMNAVRDFNKRSRALGMQEAVSSQYETGPVKRYGRKKATDIANRLLFIASQSKVLLSDAARNLAKEDELIEVGFTGSDLESTGATADAIQRDLQERFNNSGSPLRLKAVNSARKAAGLGRIEKLL